MKYLLPNVEKFYKANLHTHSMVSDGKLTPEEVKAAYKEQGYSILAMTDHSVIVDHRNLNDPDFLMLTGCEIDVTDMQNAEMGKPKRCIHLCVIAKDPQNLWLPFEDPYPKESSLAYYDGVTFDNMEWVYSPEHINAIIAKTNEKGFFVTYNHPCWSMEYYQDYAPLKGLWGMEYRNTGCVSSGYDENNGWVYREFLKLGNRMVPVCADDMHRAVKPNGYKVLGGSWNMIGAEKLDYASVVEAMEKGDLYASCGPEIHSLTLENGILRIRCSEAVSIQVLSHTRWAKLAIPQDGEMLTEAEFDLNKFMAKYGDDPACYIRLIVTDATGKYAVTRAYWGDELA